MIASFQKWRKLAGCELLVSRAQIVTPMFEGQASQNKAEIPTKTRVTFGFQVPYN